MDEYLVNMQHTVIPSWYQREGYVQAMATLIERELRKFDRPDDVRTLYLRPPVCLGPSQLVDKWKVNCFLQIHPVVFGGRD